MIKLFIYKSAEENRNYRACPHDKKKAIYKYDIFKEITKSETVFRKTTWNFRDKKIEIMKITGEKRL